MADASLTLCDSIIAPSVARGMTVRILPLDAGYPAYGPFKDVRGVTFDTYNDTCRLFFLNGDGSEIKLQKTPYSLVVEET